MPISISDDPDRWLTEQLAWLQAALAPEAGGRCRPYVLMPDGTVHTRRDRRWDDRRWASLSQTYDIACNRARWRVAQTTSRAAKPKSSVHAVPVHHTIQAAERDARRRARQARARGRQRQRWQDDVARALDTGPQYWGTDDFHAFLASLPIDRARWIMVRLLGHLQEGRCGVCGRASMRLVLDHDHVTGLVRGGLCGGCNSAEGGGISWSPELELRLQAYRDNPPAAAFGWPFPEMRYERPYGI